MAAHQATSWAAQPRSPFAERVRSRLEAGRCEAYMHLRGEPLRPLTGWLKSAADFDAAEAAVLQHHTRDQVVVVFHEAI